jgi:hypothetical protein
LINFQGGRAGYATLPVEIRRQIVRDVPLWSELVAHEARAFGCRYIDTSDDFASRLGEAGLFLAAT